MSAQLAAHIALITDCLERNFSVHFLFALYTFQFSFWQTWSLRLRTPSELQLTKFLEVPKDENWNHPVESGVFA